MHVPCPTPKSKHNTPAVGLKATLQHFTHGRSISNKLPQLAFIWECFPFSFVREG